MAGNTGGPGTQADQPDPVGRMSELFAQVRPEHVKMFAQYSVTMTLAQKKSAWLAQTCFTPT